MNHTPDEHLSDTHFLDIRGKLAKSVDEELDRMLSETAADSEVSDSLKLAARTFSTIHGAPAEESSANHGFLSSVTDDVLMDDIAARSDAHDEFGVPVEYLLHRESLMASSFELNRRCRIAPRFRGYRRPPGPLVKYKREGDPDLDKYGRTIRYRTTADVQLTQDRMMIDLDWIAVRGGVVRVGRKEAYRSLFNKDQTLNRNVATDFVKVEATAAEKLGWLNLPTDSDLPWELDALQTNRTRDLFANVLNGGRGSTRGVFRRCYDTVLSESLSRAGTNALKKAKAVSTARAWACDRLAAHDFDRARRLHAKWEGLDKPVEARSFRRMLDKAEKDASSPKEIRTMAARDIEQEQLAKVDSR